jgi:hypothetical protein
MIQINNLSKAMYLNLIVQKNFNLSIVMIYNHDIYHINQIINYFNI